jgi:hypothetical protein
VKFYCKLYLSFYFELSKSIQEHKTLTFSNTRFAIEESNGAIDPQDKL